MGSKFWILILGLAVLNISTCSGRAINDATDESGDNDNMLTNNEETSTSTETEEWLKVTLAPEAHVQHKLGSPLDLECEILGTPPPQVKWIRGPYNSNSADELSSNVISEGSGGVARVRARLFLDHIPTVGEHRFTCVGQVGGQVVHATTIVKTSASDIFPMTGVNVRRHPLPQPSMDLANHWGLGSSAGPAAPRITKWYNVLLVTIGSTVELPCGAYAQPSPQVYWMDNNDNIISKRDPRFKVRFDGSLVIVNLKWDDMGEFHCVAKNDLGKDTKGSFIYPMLRD